MHVVEKLRCDDLEGRSNAWIVVSRILGLEKIKLGTAPYVVGKKIMCHRAGIIGILRFSILPYQRVKV